MVSTERLDHRSYFFNFFSNSITTNTSTPAPAAIDRSQPLSGATSKNLVYGNKCKTMTRKVSNVKIIACHKRWSHHYGGSTNYL